MITLKKWNSLSAKKRRDIADIVFGDTPSYYREAATMDAFSAAAAECTDAEMRSVYAKYSKEVVS